MSRRLRAHNLIRYSWKGPGHGRASFTIYEDIKSPDGKRRTATIRDERIKAINQAYKLKRQNLSECIIQIKEIVSELYEADRRRRGIYVHNSENYKVLDDFWEKEYSFRRLISPETAALELKRSVEALGSLSIYSASREEIQNAIDSKYSGRAQIRIVQRLTQLLKFIGRENIRLRRQPQDVVNVSYLNENEFKKLLTFIENPVEKALVSLCYYSGLRLGEAFGLTPQSFFPPNQLKVIAQVDRKGQRRHTKTRRPRTAFIFDDGIEAFHTWMSFSQEQRNAIDRNEASRKLMRKYCEKAFPNEPSKHLTFHALRHCYAINLLTKGVSMSLVAQSLGNTLSVCQQYYVGFELKPESIEAINAILKAQNN